MPYDKVIVHASNVPDILEHWGLDEYEQTADPQHPSWPTPLCGCVRLESQYAPENALGDVDGFHYLDDNDGEWPIELIVQFDGEKVKMNGSPDWRPVVELDMDTGVAVPNPGEMETAFSYCRLSALLLENWANIEGF